MRREAHAARTRECPLLRNCPHKAASFQGVARDGIRCSRVCLFAGNEKRVEHSPHPVAFTRDSSSKSSSACASISMMRSAATRFTNVDATCTADGAAKPFVAGAASVLKAAAGTEAAASPHSTHNQRFVKRASLGASWSAANSVRCSSRRNNGISGTPVAGLSARAGPSRSLPGFSGIQWRILRGTSAMHFRVAATAAWAATVATAAGAATPPWTASLRAYKAAALLLPPLLLSTCCRETYAATTAAPHLLRSQSAFIPAFTIAALSLASSPPCSDLVKQSRSPATPGQPDSAGQLGRCNDVCNKENNCQSCRRGGLLHMLRRRGTSISTPLDRPLSHYSWTAAVAGSDSLCTRRNEETFGVSAGPCCTRPLSRSPSNVCSVASELPGAPECKGFLSPLSSSTCCWSSGLSTRAGDPTVAGRTASVYCSTCCGSTVAQQPAPSRAAPLGHLFALASSTSGDGGGSEGQGGDANDAVAKADDRFYAHLQQPEHPAFDLMWQEPVPEMQLHVAYYVHRRTGVRVFSLAAAPEEKEKVFCVSFRTPVSDSTGVPHILEHSVLSGSKKYPLKEPFAELLKGSMYSFLNAFTYSEHTSYPVASVNTKDFYNLASVYLDAVLQPRVAHDIDVFRQEGWRVEASLPEAVAGGAEGTTDSPSREQDSRFEAKKNGTEEGKQRIEETSVAAGSRASALNRAAGTAAEGGAAGNRLPLTKRAKLSYQGVVLNEMKGVYSQPSWLLYNLRMKTIFPAISAYFHDSGGNPEVIPSLSYDQFKAFFKRFYSLSSARVFFWGSDDVSKRLDFIDKNIQELDHIPPRNDVVNLSSRINRQPAFKEPVRVRQPYPATTAEMEDYVSVAWVLDPEQPKASKATAAATGGRLPWGGSGHGRSLSERLSPTDRLALTVLDYLLMGTPAAPLYKALSSSQLGKEVIGGGLSEHKHFVFSAGLKGVPQEQDKASDAGVGAAGVAAGHFVNQTAVERIEKLVLETLERCADSGFEADAIEAAMNTVEFRLREFNTGNYPKGLATIIQIVSDWMVDRSRKASDCCVCRETGNEQSSVALQQLTTDPLISLKFEKPLQNLKKRLGQGELVFQQLIKKLFLDNPHRATLHLVADAGLEKEIQRREEARIENLRQTLTDADVKRLVTETQELKAKQLAPDPPEALATIPTLELSDVEEEEEIPSEAYSLGGGAVQVLLHRLPTAGILYADVLLPLHTLNLEELQFLSLFARMLTQAGTSEMNDVQLANYIGMHTGGVHATVDIRTVGETPLRVPDPNDSLGFLVISGKALKTKVPELYHIVSLVLLDADFSNSSRGIEILKEIEASTVDSFVNSGVLAALRVGASLTASGYVAEQRAGIPYAVFIRQQLEQAKQDWKPVQEKLERIRDKLLAAAKQQPGRGTTGEPPVAFVNLTGDTETLKVATSSEGKGGRKLRHLVKLLTASLPDGPPAAAASADGILRLGQIQSARGELATDSSVKAEAFLQEQSDAAHQEPLEKVEHTRGGTRIMTACDWSSFVQKAGDGRRRWPAAAEGFVIPTQVNYVYLGGRMLSPGERFYGHMSVVAEALSSNYVWDQVRVVGGAYGGSFSVNGAGTYVFRSYRDPQLLETLRRYQQAAAGLEEFTDSLNERGLTRAIIAVLRRFSQPQPNDQKGYTALWRHIAGETKEHRAQYRNEVMRTTPQHFREFAARLQKLLQPRTSEAAYETSCTDNGDSIVAVVGSDKAFEEAISGTAQPAREPDGRGAPFLRAACPLRFKLLDVKRATASTGTHGAETISVS